MPSRLLGSSTVRNQMRFAWNFVFEKFFLISKKVFLRFFKKKILLVLLQKRFSSQFVVDYVYKNAQSLRIKIFKQSRRYRFVLYYIIFAWVKFHVKTMKFNDLDLTKVKNVLPTSFLALHKQIPLIFNTTNIWINRYNRFNRFNSYTRLGCNKVVNTWCCDLSIYKIMK